MTDAVLNAPDWVIAGTLAAASDFNGTAVLYLHPDAPFEVPEQFRSHIGVQSLIEAIQPLDAYGFILIPAYGGMDSTPRRSCASLREQNARLKRLLAGAELEKDAFGEVAKGKF